MMIRHYGLVTFMVMMLMVTQTSAQSMSPPVTSPLGRQGHVDYPAVPLEQMADAILILVPDETFDLLTPTAHERVIRGSIVRLDKGPLPQTIVHTPNTFGNSLQAGVPAKLFVKKFKDRDAYYIIGAHPLVSGEKP